MKRIFAVVLLIVTVTICSALALRAGAADKFETLYKFVSISQGAHPEAPLARDSGGNLYGTTSWDGTVFELEPNSDGSWSESVLYNFGKGNQDGGNYPEGPLTLDSAGNLYGTLPDGGAKGLGMVYELTPDGDGTWTKNVLYSFCSLSNCADGSGSFSGVIFDQKGNLYGTTSAGGRNGPGTVFKLAPNGSGGWTESVIYDFPANGSDGLLPLAGLIFDNAGNLYGTTVGGGLYHGGTVFRLSQSKDGTWTHAKLYQFCRLKNCPDGGNPYAGVIFDSAGNLYGTTKGGGTHGVGVVFQLSPTAEGQWNEKVLHQFTGGDDGALPLGGVTFDSTGRLYGTASEGGSDSCPGGGCGTVFSLAKDSNGVWQETTIREFGLPAAHPAAGLIFSQGVLYGTTAGWPKGDNFGSVYEVIP